MSLQIKKLYEMGATLTTKLFTLVVFGVLLISSLSNYSSLPTLAQYGCGEFGNNSLGYSNNCDAPLSDTENGFDAFTCTPGDSVADVALIQQTATCTGTLADGFTNPDPGVFSVGVNAGSLAACSFAANDKDFTCNNVNVGTTIGTIQVIGRVDSGSTFNITVGSGPAVNYEIEVNEAVTFYSDNTPTPFAADPGEIAVSEGGVGVDYFFSLNRQPTSDVSFDISTDSQVTLSGGNTQTVTFTNGNWDTLQSVTVLAEDDTISETTTHPGFVSHSAITTTDPIFNGITLPFQVQANITDDDSAGIVLGGVTGNAITMPENNSTFDVELELTSSPQAGQQVVIDITSSNGEGTVSTNQVTFDDTNFDTPQTLTITSVNDDIDRDDTGTITLTVNDGLSDDAFDGLSESIDMTYSDDDTAGFEFNIAPLSVDVNENGSTQYQVRLTSEPSTAGNVTLVLAPSSTTISLNSEAAGINATLDFTSSDWDTFQPVTVNGEDDANGINETESINHTVQAGSPSTEYAIAQSDDINVNVFDDDAAGAQITNPGDGSVDVDEANSAVTDTYTISLNTTPAGNADVDITVDPDLDLEVDTGSGFGAAGASSILTLTQANSWTDTVTVRANDDVIVEGSHTGIIAHTSSSTDGAYNGIAIADQIANVLDNDSADFTVTQNGADPAENGGSVQMDIVLDAEPESNVYIVVENLDIDRVSIPAPSNTGFDYHFEFTPANWDTTQNFTVTAIDNDVDRDWDATLRYKVVDSASNDFFDVIADKDITIDILDDDTTGLNIYETSTTTPVGSLDVEEGVATGESFDVVLNSQPLNTSVFVTVSGPQLDLNGLGEGNNVVLTFNTSNWYLAQTVSVEADDDDIDEGGISSSAVSYSLSSTDNLYNSLGVTPTLVNITDNDTAGLDIVPSTASNAGITEGLTGDILVKLDSEPTSNVEINLSSNNTGEVSIDTSTLLFTPTNWDNYQTVVATAVEDNIDRNGDTADITFTVVDAASAPEYDPLSDEVLTYDVTDNDTAAVNIVPTGADNTVTEGGSGDTFAVELATEPQTQVTIDLTPNSELSVTPTQLVYNVGQTTQTVNVSAVNDDIDNGNRTQPISFTASAASGPYDGITINNTQVNIVDNDTAGILVTATSSTTSESGTTSTIQFELLSEPTADVTINVSSSNPAEGSIPSSTVVITPANWNIPSNNTLVVTGQDDNLQDGDVVYTIITGDVTSPDGVYNALGNGDVQDVTLTNIDNETAGITQTVTGSVFATREADNSAINYQFDLATDPGTTVSLPLTLSDGTEASFQENTVQTNTNITLTFGTPTDVFVYGVDDSIIDGDIQVTLTPGDPTSSNPEYNDLDANDLFPMSFNNEDDDTSGFVLTPTAGGGALGGSTELTITEGGSEDFDVVLQSEPTSNVTLTITTSDSNEADLSTTTLIFTPANWDQPQTVTVTNADDDMLTDDSATITVAVDNANSPAEYSGASSSFTASIPNTDVADIIVTQTGGSTEVTEGGASDTYTIELSAIPTQDVTFTLGTDSDVNTAPTSVTFTSGGASNWDQPQTITVTAEDDMIIEPQETSVVTHTITTTDPDYGALSNPNLNVTVDDNDTPGFTITPNGGVGGGDLTITEGASETFDVVLDGQPSSDVVIDITTSDAAEATPSVTSLTFTPANWDTVQTVTVTNTDDNVIASDTATITLTVNNGASATEYQNVTADIDVIIVDNDSANVIASAVSNTTSEDGTVSATVEFTLTTVPAGDVVLDLEIDDDTEGSLAVTQLTITPANYNTGSANTVVISGVDDNLVDGTVNYNLEVVEVTSNDTDYDALDDTSLAPVALENTDDDTGLPTVSITYQGNAPTNLIGNTSETGTTAVAQFELSKQPVNGEDVTIVFESSDTTEGSVAVSSFTIENANWNNPLQNQVTITGVDDDIDDGTIEYELNLTDITSDDEGYDVVEDGDLLDGELENEDNDTRGVNLSATSFTLTESQTTEFTVELESQPTEDTRIDFTYDEDKLRITEKANNAATQAIMDFVPLRLQTTVESFTFNENNWDQPKTFELTAVDNSAFVGNDIIETVTTSLDTNGDYDGVAVPNLSVTIQDNDTETTPRTGGNALIISTVIGIAVVGGASYAGYRFLKKKN